MSTIPQPDEVLARGDPGDETASRYRFQWTWAAIVCCMLLDDTEDVVEVFCEHHEDVLLKHRDGAFTGHQVKTRGDDQPPWKAGDEPLLAACARFARLDAEFPGRFRRFCFLTNHTLYVAGNGQDFAHVLKQIADATTVDQLPRNVATWLRRVARKAEVTDSVAFAAMSKTVARADLPKLRDVTMRLIHTLADCWPPAADCSHDAVRRAARALIDECGRASSLDHQQLLPAYIVAVVNPEQAELCARINGKRITSERLSLILETGRDSTATLAGDPQAFTPPGQGSTELMHKKLDAGGFSAVSRNSAEDLRNKADYLGIKWTKQYGNTKGLARYDHIRTLVLTDAARAFEATQSGEGHFGPAMREDLKRRFQQRRANRDQLYDCADEHLEGVAFSLTAQCKVQWSTHRSWEAT
ncbi:MAG: hypothetical protein FLDDKLPJ_02332 [Phycisphaerae bacterium]|nr:hypothetical protein [Phycisphaerae bacterium]